MTPAHVTVVEVGPRDGLQNEHASITTLEFNRRSATGLPEMIVAGLNDTCHLKRVQTKVWRET